MFQSTDEALQVVRTASSQRPFDEARYLETCEYLVDNRGQLTRRVFINLPGGLSGNRDPRWDRVKQNSQERCSCGNERVILPGNPRVKYEASEKGAVVVSAGNEVYLRPIGGDKASTYMKLWIEAEAAGLAYMPDPFAPFVLTPDIFSTKGYALQQLADVLPKHAEPPVMFTGKERTPLFAIRAVDPVAKTVTIVLDKAIEAFDPDAAPEKHSC